MVLGVLWDKVWRDLWEHKGRTIQVVLIIAVGTFAIGMILATRQFMITGMEGSWRQSSPAAIYLWNDPPVDDAALDALARVEGVTELEGLMQQSIEWRLTPDEPWKPAGLNARDDFESQKLAKMDLLAGTWPHKNLLAVGQGGDTMYGIGPGSRVYVRIANHESLLPVSGVVYDPNTQPPNFGGNIQFYATREEYGNLTGDERFNRILISTWPFEQTAATALADEVQDKLEKQDVESGGFTMRGERIANPNKHFFQDSLDALFFIMGFMAIITLLLGLFLVYNTITALISRQTNQIGILKAIGARTRTIALVYLAVVLGYGILALLLAVPLSAISARMLGDYLLGAFNVEGGGTFELTPVAIVVQVVIALVAPLLIAIIPIHSGARITVREAISTYGLNTKPSLLDRMLAKVRGVPEMLLLTFSNTFRHKQRVILTEITLVLSGLIFMTVMTTRDSALYTYGDLLFSILNFDVNFATERPERIERVEAVANGQPGVAEVEVWSLQNGTIRPVGQPESNADKRITLFGVPLPTTLYGPQLRAGRWLQPGDTHAIVLNQKLANDTGIKLGDTITIKPGLKDESDWQVVGLIFDPVIINSAHVPRDVLALDLHELDRANTIWIQTTAADGASQRTLARTLRDVYTDNRVRLQAASVFGKDTASEIIDGIMNQFAVIITLLATMAVLIAFVGSLALSGVLSLNVLERRREIGVLRAIGASSRTIFGLFIGEGLILGWLSWLIALPLSIPAGRLLLQGLSAALGGEIVYKYSPVGPMIWLGIITVLAVLASGLPARAASRISVRKPCL
ncbi:MAG: FtsX-like permease family protein [Anaerolineales bacterium]|nr:FtsX-like permease family protein [Anaerolineales bacterium]